MLVCSTSPYFSKRRVTSSSVREGWMPVTKRLEPSLRLPSSSSSLRGAGGGPLRVPSARAYFTVSLATYRLSRSSRPLGEALRTRELSTSRRSPRGDRLRSRS